MCLYNIRDHLHTVAEMNLVMTVCGRSFNTFVLNTQEVAIYSLLIPCRNLIIKVQTNISLENQANGNNSYIFHGANTIRVLSCSAALQIIIITSFHAQHPFVIFLPFFTTVSSPSEQQRIRQKTYQQYKFWFVEGKFFLSRGVVSHFPPSGIVVGQSDIFESKQTRKADYFVSK